MGYYKPDVYNQPEAFGLRLIGAAYLPDCDAYGFHIVAAFRDKDGGVWAAEDSGCSCPQPFESHTSMDDLTRIESVQDWREFASFREDDGDDSVLSGESWSDYVAEVRADVLDVERRIVDVLREGK